MSKEITSLKYSEKIVEIAYYNFPLVHPKETVIKCVDALIKEYSDQQNKELLEQLADIKENEKHYVDKCFRLEEQLVEKENCIINLNNSRNGLICELAEKEKELSEVKQEAIKVLSIGLKYFNGFDTESQNEASFHALNNFYIKLTQITNK